MVARATNGNQGHTVVHLHAPLHTSTKDFDWLRVPTTSNHILAFNNLINLKSVRTWLLVLCCSTLHITYSKWQPPRRPFDFHLATGSVPKQPPCMRAPPKLSIKEVHATSLGSLLVSHISHRHCQASRSC